VTVLVLIAVWWLALACFVLLKARQPHWEHPRPPKHASRLDEPAWPQAA
jgi:hypothetical protein